MHLGSLILCVSFLPSMRCAARADGLDDARDLIRQYRQLKAFRDSAAVEVQKAQAEVDRIQNRLSAPDVNIGTMLLLNDEKVLALNRLQRALIHLKQQESTLLATLKRMVGSLTQRIQFEPRAANHAGRGLLLLEADSADFWHAAIQDFTLGLLEEPRQVDCLLGRCDAFVRLGKLQDAIVDLSAVIEVQPQNDRLLIVRAGLHLRVNRETSAIDDYSTATIVNPKNVDAWNGLAWHLATSTDRTLRNGKRAVEAAERACKLTHFDQPIYLDTLAAAYAEVGDFAKAQEYQRKALADPRLEKSLPATELVKAKKRLELFARQEPWREEVGK